MKAKKEVSCIVMCVCVLKCRTTDGTVLTINRCFDCLKGTLENEDKRTIFEASRTK